MTSTLIVCRDRELLKLIREALGELPVRISRELESSRGVPDAVAETAASLAIVDMFLPGTTGMEVLKSIKKVKESAEVVLISRLRTRAAIDRAFRYGAIDVLVYPFDADTLRQTVAHRLELMAKPGIVV